MFTISTSFDGLFKMFTIYFWGGENVYNLGCVVPYNIDFSYEEDDVDHIGVPYNIK